MIKTTYSTMLLVIGFLAVMLMLPSAHLNAGAIDNPNDSPASSISNVNQSDIKGLNQSESPLLMAQTTEEHRSSDELFEFHGRGAAASAGASFLREFLELHEIHDRGAAAEHCVSHCRDHYKKVWSSAMSRATRTTTDATNGLGNVKRNASTNVARE